MLGYFDYQFPAIFCWDIDSIIDLRQFAFGELDIKYRTNDLSDLSYIFFRHICHS